MTKAIDNNAALKKLWVSTGLTQNDALLLLNDEL